MKRGDKISGTGWRKNASNIFLRHFLKWKFHFTQLREYSLLIFQHSILMRLDNLTTLYGITSSYFNKVYVQTGLGIGTAFLSNIHRIVLSHGYRCVYKKRFRSRFQPWPEAIKWKEAREDASVYTRIRSRGLIYNPEYRDRNAVPTAKAL